MRQPAKALDGSLGLALPKRDYNGGFIVWLCGLENASGHTLASALRRLLLASRTVEILDVEDTAAGLQGALVDIPADERKAMQRRMAIHSVGHTARALARHGLATLVVSDAISAQAQAHVELAAKREGLPFVLVTMRPDPALAAVSEQAQDEPAREPWLSNQTVYVETASVASHLATVVEALRDRHLSAANEITDAVDHHKSLLPVFLRLDGKQVVVLGGTAKLQNKLTSLLDCGARVTIIAPSVDASLMQPGVHVVERAFTPSDLDNAWLVVLADSDAVNREAALAAEERHLFVSTFGDSTLASACEGGVLRRGGVTVAISTEGYASALASLLREGLDALVPREIPAWVETARALRLHWDNGAVSMPMPTHRPILLQAINGLYDSGN